MLADAAGKRLFIADTGHNRIIQTEPGRGRTRSRSAAARRDLTTATIEKATFNRPQGMCLDGETLYVADTENHAIRAVDLKERKVTTIAGIGTQTRGIPHPGDSGRPRRPRFAVPGT